MYYGCCKTGDHKNVPIAFAMVPSETTDNYIWVFLNFKAGGIPLQNLVVISDRGKQMNAVKRLHSYGCNWLHIKNCTYHIAKNVCSRYSNKDVVLNNMVFGIRATNAVEGENNVM
jgi:MULE transposase domain